MIRQVSIRLHPNSFIARIAAGKLKERSVAITIGRHIYLYGICKDDFLKDKNWICHELAHVEQYAKHGLLRFIFLYLKESIINGYFNNRFEVDARNREHEITLLEKYRIT